MHPSTTRGYTLIEMIVTVAVFTVVLVTVMNVVLFLYRANANSIEQAFALASAQRGTEQMVRDMREAAYADDGSFPLITIEPYEFAFYADTDRDVSVERIRYFLQGSNLIRATTNATGSPPVYNDANEELAIVSEDVRNIEEGIDLFTYNDEDHVPVTASADILEVRFVSVNMIVNINPSRLPEEFTLRSSATLRNLKDNL